MIDWDKVWSKKERQNRRHRDIWTAVSPFIKGKVLDLGCGPCAFWIGREVDLTGIDQSSEALKQAKINYPKGTYILSSVLSTGLESKQYDTIMMLGLLDYFEDWEPILNEARRLKKPNGKIVATLLNGYENHDWTKYPRITGNWHLKIEGGENASSSNGAQGIHWKSSLPNPSGTGI